MRKDRTILQMIIPFVVMVSLVSFCMIKGCHGQIRKDYQDHFVCGTLVGMTGAVVDFKRDTPILSATVAGIIVGGGKELVYDKWMGRGTPEWKDAAYTIAGAALVGVIVKGFTKISSRWEYGNTTVKGFDYSYRPPTDRRIVSS